MSIHSSLRISSTGVRHRSVLKRHERLKLLQEKKLWDPTKPVLGIQKVKMQKLKVKKEKAKVEATAGGAPATGAPTTPAATAKTADSAKATKK